MTLNNSSISKAGAWTYSVAWIRDHDHHEVLEVRLLEIEYSLFFENLFDDLKEKCLRVVKLIVPDLHKVDA